MNILAVTLFGSWARRDQTPKSDVDFLIITSEETPPRHSNMGNVSFYVYNDRDFSQGARSGDLFVWHVLFEGRPTYDPSNYFNSTKEHFQLKECYSQEIGHGAGLAWLICRFSNHFRSSSLAARRAAWAVRTVLIGRTAQTGRPLFSARELAAFAKIASVPRLIHQKRSRGLSRKAALDLFDFLTRSELPDPVPAARSVEDYRASFLQSGNVVGLAFIDANHTQRGHGGYL